MSSEQKDEHSGVPAPEVLKPQSDHESSTPEAAPSVQSKAAKPTKRPRRGTYRPSHKATFIGLSVVGVILVINASIIAFLMMSQSDAAEGQDNEVTIGPLALDKLGVSRSPVGNEGVELTIGPDTQFRGTVTIAEDVSIGGKLQLNGAFSANSADFANLKAGKTSLGQLNVNGDGTLSNVNVREQLAVAGSTRLQGPVTVSQLLTVNNNMNVAGSLAVGGTLSARNFQANNLTSGSSLTVGGHIVTRGSAPSVSPGSAIGSNGTVSISGNDASGTVAVNAGVGAGGGIVANVAFRNSYGATPHVVVTPVGPGANGVYIQRHSGGFSIGVSGGLSTGGHAFDYIVMQ